MKKVLLKTYINGMIDLVIEINQLQISDLIIDDLILNVNAYKIYGRKLNQQEIKNLIK